MHRDIAAAEDGRAPAWGLPNCAFWLLLCLLLGSAVRAFSATDFHSWAPSPPMGWNSWDCFATTVTEAQTKAQADVMAEKLARYGWQYIVVDIQWYEPQATGFEYRKGAKLTLDQWGRLLPASNRFPSGFNALGDHIHGKGLKFGIHLMRGIPRLAVAQNTAIKGSSFRAADIADTNSLCSWNTDMYGVDTSRPGAQEYYDSVFELIASWGVDFVKVDDLSRPYHQGEIEAIRKAIDRTGRPMVLSTSPGETPLTAGEHVLQHANMWRISDDFWDHWPELLAQFKRLRDWTPYRGPGHFPDADMLPLGVLDMGKRATHFTHDEQYTLLSLWCIARSPLMLGADLTRLDHFTLSLLTNDEVLAVNQRSSANHELFNRDGLFAWVAEVPNSTDQYFGLFNTREAPGKVPIQLGGASEIRDLWQHKELGQTEGEFAPELAPHGAKLYRLSPGTIGRQTAPATAPFSSRHTEPRLHDPSTIVKCKDEYWLFSTGFGISSRHSKDLVNWNPGPKVFATPPAWTPTAVPGNRAYFWAPDVIHLTNGYFLYYSVSTWGRNTSAIGLATNPTLDPSDRAYGWTERGVVVRSSDQDDYNAIDPSVARDADGRLWLAFGSYWSGIKLVELNPQTGLRMMTNSPLYPLAWHDSIEAACLYQHGNSYYLFVNWGRCCLGTNSTYEIRVGRSDRITGPYLDRQGKDLMLGGGSLVLSSVGYRVGPGHAGILRDGAREYFSYHFYHAEQGGRPMLEVAPLGWSEDGWPEVGPPLPVHQVGAGAQMREPRL